MKRLAVRDVIAFVFSAVFIPFFTGLYSVYEVYHQHYYSNGYEWIGRKGNYVPTKLEMLVLPFRDIQSLAFSLIVSLVFVIMARKLKTLPTSKTNAVRVLYISFTWTVLCTALYAIGKFSLLSLVGHWPITSSIYKVRQELLIFIILFFILSIPVNVFFSWSARREQGGLRK